MQWLINNSDIQDSGFFNLCFTRYSNSQGLSFTATAGLIFFFLSLKLRFERKLGRQHCVDLRGFSFSDLKSPFGVLPPLQTELGPEARGVPFADSGGKSSIVRLTSIFPLDIFCFPKIFSSLPSMSFLMLSSKSSASFFFLPVGDGVGIEAGTLFSKGALLAWGVPMETFGWTGVLPRDGVKSALEATNKTYQKFVYLICTWKEMKKKDRQILWFQKES